MLKFVTKLLIFLLFVPPPDLQAADSLLTILREELTRENNSLAELDDPSYYIDYRVDEIESVSLRASFGSLVENHKNKGRILTTTVRVGNYQFDNTHEFTGEITNPRLNMPFTSPLPLENEPEAIKQVLWRATDQAYKNALSSYTGLKARKKNNDTDQSLPDFSIEPPARYYESPISEKELAFDQEKWISRLKQYSILLDDDSLIFHSEASLQFVKTRKYFVSSENSEIVQNFTYARLHIMSSIKHNNGNVFPLNKSYTSFTPGGLPDHKTVLKDIQDLYATLQKIKKSPMAEPYAGPAILSPEAAGVFFHEIFGHRIEGHRLERLSDAQTFKDKIGDRVLPKHFQVISDPTISEFNGQDLIGTYHYDDQGVEAKKVRVVQDGILRHFLMSRHPTKEFSHSSGHGRAQAGFAPVSRQSNLIIKSDQTYSHNEMKKQLIKECKKQNKEYGYYFKQVIGGLTVTDRYNTNMFNIKPVEVYRIYVDGRPDELVSGVELIGTPLTMFSNIISAGDEQKVFTGFCGAESGHIPVTAIAPALFVKKIETQKTPEIDSKLPILPSP
ncbi:MAG: TldD/PmbA family protein [Bacteroidales bacterium]|jgi:TldD protein